MERRRQFQRILIEQAVSLTGGQVVDHFFYDDPRNKATYLAVGFAKKSYTYEELVNLYRSANDIEKSLLNIDFKTKLDHVMLSVKLCLAHFKAGKYDEYVTMMNNLLYLVDCLSFVDNLPQNIKSPQDLLVLEPKMVVALAPILINKMESPKSKRMLTIQHNGEYLVARDDLILRDYLDDRSIAEVFRDFTVAQGKALPEPPLENFMPITSEKVPVYSSPFKAVQPQPTTESTKPVPLQTATVITKPMPPVKISYAQAATTKPAQSPAKQERTPALTWLRDKKPSGYQGQGAYKVFGTKHKTHNSVRQYPMPPVELAPDKPKISGKAKLRG